MNDRRESDSPVVAAKLAHKAGRPAAEPVEGRRLDKGNTDQQNALRTQGREARASSALERVRQVAMKDKEARFTALLHHVGVDRLRVAYRAFSPTAAAGVDEVTWESYGQELEANLRPDLLGGTRKAGRPLARSLVASRRRSCSRRTTGRGVAAAPTPRADRPSSGRTHVRYRANAKKAAGPTTPPPSGTNSIDGVQRVA